MLGRYCHPGSGHFLNFLYLIENLKISDVDKFPTMKDNLKKNLAKDCNFTAVTAEQNRDCAIRNAFISGIHHQLKENKFRN